MIPFESVARMAKHRVDRFHAKSQEAMTAETRDAMRMELAQLEACIVALRTATVFLRAEEIDAFLHKIIDEGQDDIFKNCETPAEMGPALTEQYAYGREKLAFIEMLFAICDGVAGGKRYHEARQKVDTIGFAVKASVTKLVLAEQAKEMEALKAKHAEDLKKAEGKGP